MDPRYHHYSRADRLFYDAPGPALDAGDFAAVLPALPSDWREADHGVWRVLTAEGAALPDQGWKIHISGTPGNAEKVVTTAAEYCIPRRIPWKHQRSPAAVRECNAKTAPRPGSGKVVTIYPRDETQLAVVLAELSAALAGEPGPYVLSDLRYGDGPLYVRYGAFLTRFGEIDGVRVPVLRRPDGSPAADERRPGFHPPSWVALPACLQPSFDALTGAGGADLPFEITEALHHSNGGGVYRGRHRDTGRVTILKEARPHAGLDANGTDAPSRLAHEHATLTRLAGIPGIPAVDDPFTAWEHTFLPMRDMPGRPLGAWQAIHYPLTRPTPTEQQLQDYTRRALAVVDRLETIVAAVHARGVVHGDLHPGNVLVDDDDHVALVDFEASVATGTTARPSLAVPGFRPPADRTGPDIDRYALAALKLTLFLPLAVVLELAPDKLIDYLTFINTRFPLPAHYAAGIRGQLTTRTTLVRTPAAVPHPAAADFPALLSTAIRASATPHRADRLYPGDIEQFTSGGTSFGYGAAGVLYAVHVTTGTRVPDHEEWLLRADRREPAQRPGLLDGACGIAFALEHLGHHDDATRNLDRAVALTAATTDHSYGSGLAGAALTLLDFGRRRGDPRLTDRAVVIARDLAARLPHLPSPGPAGRAGLFWGWAGPALLFIRLFELTAENRWLGCADQALGRDLAECVEIPGHGKFQVRDRSRSLPYLDVGSAGVAIVLDQLAGHDPDAVSAAQLDPLILACCGEFVVQPGLRLGRAGLLLTLAALRRRRAIDDPARRSPPAAGADRDDSPVATPALLDAAIARHLDGLRLHAVRYGRGVAFPGNQGLRLSMDVATGTAGVALAVASVTDPRAGLPLVAPLPPG
jgi:hypothetical protein